MHSSYAHEKIRVLRNALGDFLKHVKERGYPFDEPGNPLLDFLTDHKDGPLSGSRLIKSVLVVINAEEFLDSRFRKN